MPRTLPHVLLASALAGAFLFALCGAAVVSARASDWALDDALHGLEAGPMEVLVDASAELDLSAALRRPAKLWEPQEQVFAGHTDAAYWLRFDLGDTRRGGRWLVEVKANLPHFLDAWIVDWRGTGRPLESWKTGLARPFSSRDLADPGFIFRLPQRGQAEGLTFYARLRSDSPMAFTVDTLRLEDWAARRSREQLAGGIFFGVLLVLVVIHLGLFAVLRDLLYLEYTAFLAALTLAMAYGDGVIFLLLPADLTIPTGLILVAIAASVFFAASLAVRLLEAPKTIPRLSLFLRISQVLSAVAVLAAPFVSYSLLARFVGGLLAAGSAILLTSGVLAWRRGHRAARLYCLAWGMLLGTQVLAGLVRWSAVGLSPALLLVLTRVGIVLTVTIFALALADRLRSARAAARRQRAEARRERERLIASLEDRNAELRRFSSTLSHELKSPLVTAKGFLGLVERGLAGDPPDTARLRRDVGRAAEATDTMGRLLDDLVELSEVRLEPRRKAPIELDDVFAEVLAQRAESIEAGEVDVEITRGRVIVLADRVRLCSLFLHLVDNALRAMDEAPAPRLEMGALALEDRVICHVRDTGKGIDPRYHEKVFELFQRLDPQEAPGTGIGLALVRRIAESHGGAAWVESGGAGQGTTVWVRLPRDSSATR